MKGKQIKGCVDIINSHSIEEKENKAEEECLELALAIKHYRQGKVSLQDVITEIADVLIMCEQLMMMHECRAAVDKEIDFKIARTLRGEGHGKG